MGKSKKQRNHEYSGGVNLVTITDKASPIAEQYRTIRTNIQFASVNRKIQTIVVTSSGPLEGKSTTAANVAVVFAKASQRVLLVDADMRKPTVHKTFGLSNEVGLSKALISNNSVSDVSQPSMVDNLSVVTSGPKPPNPSELLSSTQMNQVIDEARHLYDVIIFDMPPVVTVTDAQIMASKADGTLLVVRESVTRKDDLTKAKKLLEMVQAQVLGVVYNGAKDVKDRSYHYYSND